MNHLDRSTRGRALTATSSGLRASLSDMAWPLMGGKVSSVAAE